MMMQPPQRYDPKPNIHAVIHSVGRINYPSDDRRNYVDDDYVPFEIAYLDITGIERHFFVCDDDKPIPEQFSSLPDDKELVTSLDNVYKFLRKQCKRLSNRFGASRTFFGYKGRKLQSRILSDAGVSNIVNVDVFGVKPLRKLDPEYGENNCCTHHTGGKGKCALTAVRLIAPIVFQKIKNYSVIDNQIFQTERDRKYFVNRIAVLFEARRKLDLEMLTDDLKSISSFHSEQETEISRFIDKIAKILDTKWKQETVKFVNELKSISKSDMWLLYG